MLDCIEGRPPLCVYCGSNWFWISAWTPGQGGAGGGHCCREQTSGIMLDRLSSLHSASINRIIPCVAARPLIDAWEIKEVGMKIQVSLSPMRGMRTHTHTPHVHTLPLLFLGGGLVCASQLSGWGLPSMANPGIESRISSPEYRWQTARPSDVTNFFKGGVQAMKLATPAPQKALEKSLGIQDQTCLMLQSSHKSHTTHTHSASCPCCVLPPIHAL